MTEAKATAELRELAIQEAIALFEGDEPAAMRWIGTSQRGLGNHTPLGLLGTPKGIEKVRNLIGRLEHGIVS